MTYSHTARPADNSQRVLLRRLSGRIGRIAESTGTIAILILISAAVLALTLHRGPQPDDTPTTIERVIYWCAYLFTFLQVALHPRAIFRTATRNPFVIGVVFIAFLSAAWSDDPTVSLTRASSLAMWTLFGLYLASRYSTKDLLKHVGAALGIVAVLSVLFALVAPDYGLELQGQWRGVFTTKNVLGEIMLLGSIVFLLTAWHHRRGRATAVIGAMLTISLVVLARATGSLLILFALFAIVPTIVALVRGGRLSGVALCAILAFGATGLVAYSEREPVLSALGKDATLTGRTDLWAGVAERIAERPLLGYGYRAFWESTSGSSERIRSAVGWDVPHAHNGLLDLWLDLGMLGLLMFVIGYVMALRRAWSAMRARVGLDGLWAMTFLVMLFLGNTTESSIYSNNLIWSLFVAVSTMPFAGSRQRTNLADDLVKTRSKYYGRAPSGFGGRRAGVEAEVARVRVSRWAKAAHPPLGHAGDSRPSS